MNRGLVHLLDKIFYPNSKDNWDDKIFRKEILLEIKTNYNILEIGAGSGRILEMNFKGKCKKVFGVDIDKRVLENDLIDEAYLGLADSMPYFEDNFFDLIYCNNVLEHVELPHLFYKEISRVLKSGGIFMAKTPNKYHYVPIIASITPIGFHKFYNKLRGREYDDTFPTFYRANSKIKYKEFAENNEMKLVSIKFFAGQPMYLRIFFLTYIVGIFYERLVNFFNWDCLKTIVISKMKKK
jgi:SAM-dependent methyltransferase